MTFLLNLNNFEQTQLEIYDNKYVGSSDIQCLKDVEIVANRWGCCFSQLNKWIKLLCRQFFIQIYL